MVQAQGATLNSQIRVWGGGVCSYVSNLRILIAESSLRGSPGGQGVHGVAHQTPEESRLPHTAFRVWAFRGWTSASLSHPFLCPFLTHLGLLSVPGISLSTPTPHHLLKMLLSPPRMFCPPHSTIMFQHELHLFGCVFPNFLIFKGPSYFS